MITPPPPRRSWPWQDRGQSLPTPDKTAHALRRSQLCSETVRIAHDTFDNLPRAWIYDPVENQYVWKTSSIQTLPWRSGNISKARQLSMQAVVRKTIFNLIYGLKLFCLFKSKYGLKLFGLFSNLELQQPSHSRMSWLVEAMHCKNCISIFHMPQPTATIIPNYLYLKFKDSPRVCFPCKTIFEFHLLSSSSWINICSSLKMNPGPINTIRKESLLV